MVFVMVFGGFAFFDLERKYMVKWRVSTQERMKRPGNHAKVRFDVCQRTLKLPQNNTPQKNNCKSHCQVLPMSSTNSNGKHRTWHDK